MLSLLCRIGIPAGIPVFVSARDFVNGVKAWYQVNNRVKKYRYSVWYGLEDMIWLVSGAFCF